MGCNSIYLAIFCGGGGGNSCFFGGGGKSVSSCGGEDCSEGKRKEELRCGGRLRGGDMGSTFGIADGEFRI